MSVQDPFCLDHNTTSNVNERMRGDIEREFRRANTQCRNLIDIVDAQHAGIVELLSYSPSSVSSPATSSQLALSPQQSTEEGTGNTSVHEETAHIQLFLLRVKDLATATATDLGHRAVETEHRVSDAVGIVPWHRNVVGAVIMMLADIFDMDCVSRDQPSDQFDVQLSRHLTAEANRSGSSSSGPTRLQVGNLASISSQNSEPPSTISATLSKCISDDSLLHPHHKRQLPDAGCDADEDVDDGSDGDPSLGRNAAKRHKTNDSTSDGGVSSGSHQSTSGDSMRHILLSVDCSARSRLWVGRKKVRRQFMHFPDELKRQLEVTVALRNEVAKSDHTILEFELAVVRPVLRSNDELMLAVLPSKKTSKEFGCFITFFVSLVQKLINNITIEGPVNRASSTITSTV